MRSTFTIFRPDPLSLLVGSIVACSCSSEAGPLLQSGQRDSAGVHIVESRAPAWRQGLEWTIAPEPTLELGADQSLLRVAAAYRLEDGRIIVAHGSVPEFLIYAGDGRLLARRGRRGSGPGEFGELTRVRRGAADSIVVYDLPNARITVLAPDGRFGRHWPVPNLPDGSAALVEDVFDDGSLLVAPVGGPPTGQGMVRRERTLWRIAGDSSATATKIATFPELEMFFFDRQPSPIAWRRPFFGKTAYYTTGRDRLYWSTTDTLQIRVHSLDGTLTALHRRVREPESFDEQEVRPLIEAEVRAHRNASMRPALRRVLEDLPSSGQVPAFGWPDFGPSLGAAMLVDDGENLWVAEYYLPGEQQNERAVFDSTGAWLGTVALPPRFSPTHIGNDFVLGVWRDELDVEHIRLYALRKTAG